MTLISSCILKTPLLELRPWALETKKQGCIGMCIFMVPCLSEMLATEILMFSHLLGTNVATFTEKANLALNLKQKMMIELSI